MEKVDAGLAPALRRGDCTGDASGAVCPIRPWELVCSVMGWRRAMDAALRSRFSTTLLQQWILLMMHSKQGYTISSAAERLQINYTTVAEAVAGLERRGRVSKAVDPNDRRQVVLELTPAGAEHFGELDRELLSHAAGVWSRFPKADRRRALGLFHELLLGVGKGRRSSNLFGAAAGRVPADCVRGDSAFVNACAQLSMEFRWMCEKESCSTHQMKTLLLLEGEGCLRPKSIAYKLALRPSDVSKLLTKMERAGLVEIGRGASRREHEVALAPLGCAKALVLKAQLEELCCARFPALEDRAFMAGVFSRLVELLRENGGGA